MSAIERLSLVIACSAMLVMQLGCGGCDETGEGVTPPVCDGGSCLDGGAADADMRSLPDLGCDDEEVCACVVGPDGGFCQADFCTVTVEPGAVDSEVEISLAPTLLDENAVGGVLGGRACVVAPAAKLTFTLAVAFGDTMLPDGFAPDEVLALRLDPPARIVESFVDVGRRRVLVNLDESARVGATVAPRRPQFREELGVDRFEVVDDASYVRNISRFDFGATFHDGERFFAGNGPRLLIWNDGIPTSPLRQPDVVLGRPDLSTNTVDPSASSFGGSVRSIWSDGQRLAVSVANRILIWSEVPRTNFAPADLVLGQDDFVSVKLNRDGPPGADTLAAPDEIWSDGERFVVADSGNHRFLVWNTFPDAIGQPADLVLGQEDFDENSIGGGALPSYQARSAFWTGTHLVTSSTFSGSAVHIIEGFPTMSNPAHDYVLGLSTPFAQISANALLRSNSVGRFGDEGLFVQNNWRVSIWRTFPEDNAPSELTIGKPDEHVGGVVGRVSAASFANAAPNTHAFSRGDDFVVADGQRLLVWRSLPQYDAAPADIVIGQPAHATPHEAIDFRGIDADTLAEPGGISSIAGVTVIADRGSSRVLVVRGDLGTPDSVVVLGQPDATSFGPNRNATEISASTLSDPTNVFVDGKNLFVTDAGNHRVLIWTSLPTEDGQPADIVLGQPDFESGRPNRGAADADGDGDSDASADSLHYPSGVWADANAVYVADPLNHRVVVYGPLDAGAVGAPVGVIGQPDFESNEPNAGQGWFSPSPDGLARPTDVLGLPDGTIAVADGHNNRVVVYDASLTPTVVIGQPDLQTNATLDYLQGVSTGFPISEGLKIVSASTLRTPFGLATSADRLLVADTGNHRVVGYSYPLTDAMDADVLFGQTDFDSRSPNANGVSADSLQAAEGVAVDGDGFVLVSDSGNNRVLRIGPTNSGDRVFGQTLFDRDGPHRAAPAFGTLESPRAIVRLESTFWVADTLNHRVVSYVGDNQVRVIGQADLGGVQPNAGGPTPTAVSLSKPTDVWTDGARMVIADRNNHRVLIWNEVPTEIDTPADVALGQPDKRSGSPNRGGTVGPNTMLTPEAVWVAGDTLFVADTGNNRVLRWDEFPASDGEPATAALCQASVEAGRANRGSSTPTAATCATPSDLVLIDDSIWIADAQNHRVLGFASDFETGAEAQIVLGQPDFERRLPLNAEQRIDAATMSSPGGLAYDGVNLFVADSGNHRILVFDAVPQMSGASADRVIGQPDFSSGVSTVDLESLEAPRGLAILAGRLNSTTLWIADSGNDRIVSFEQIARLRR